MLGPVLVVQPSTPLAQTLFWNASPFGLSALGLPTLAQKSPASEQLLLLLVDCVGVGAELVAGAAHRQAARIVRDRVRPTVVLDTPIALPNWFAMVLLTVTTS